MTKARRRGLAIIILSSAISLVSALSLQRSPHSGLVDFKIVYLGAKCMLEHRDPYNESEFQQLYEAEGGKVPSEPVERLRFQGALMTSVYFPTAFLLVTPFAIFGWGVAWALWTILTVILLTLAACLMYDVGEDYAPVISVCLLGFMLANTEVLFAFGNAAGVAIGLCAIAVWCFVKERFPWAGVLCLAISLAMKPHDAAFVWLYFFLAGGMFRKRALQAVLAVFVLSLPAILWVSNIAPNWIQETRSNFELVSIKGGSSDPGPSAVGNATGGLIIDLQSAISIFRDDPHIYNPVTYILCAPILIAWMLISLRTPATPARAWLALAAIAALSMLPVYHRPYDAKLLMLAIPGCAMLWAEGRALLWPALILTSAGLIFTADIPLSIQVMLTQKLPLSQTGVLNQLLIVMLRRPIPLVLLAMGIFYLWIYMQQSGGQEMALPGEAPAR